MAMFAAVIVWVWKHPSPKEHHLPVQYRAAAQGEMEVTFLDVGEGDSAFIRTPNGHTILVDAGPGKGKYSSFDAGERVVVPFLKKNGVTRIDTIVMTHPHADHYGGIIPVLKAVEVGEFLDPGLDFPARGYERLLLELKKRKIKYRIIHAPKILKWDPSIFVQVLWPEPGPQLPGDPNNNSIVFRMSYGDVVYLFTGDMELPVEEQLYAYGHGLRTTVFKIPHHGSNTSSTRRLLELMQPRLAVMSVGYRNRFGHPDQEVIDRLKEMGIRLLRTDRNRTIRTFCDGKRVRVIPGFGDPFTIYPYPDRIPEGVK
jgi:competence protein ComEC